MKRETFFRRYEYKYMISQRQMKDLIEYAGEYIVPDEYFKSQVCSLYYDTDNYRIIRRSLEKPIYKEKIRLRSYGVSQSDSPVFLELKKKYKHVVYKRRIMMSEKDAKEFMQSGIQNDASSQIARELEYARSFYGELEPQMLIMTERLSYRGKAEPAFRITFDTNILWRDYDLSLKQGIYGKPLIDDDKVLMEIKAPMAIPLWMTDYLNHNEIRRTSFSKYGTAFNIINPWRC